MPGWVVTVMSRGALILADLLVLAITWKATFKASRYNIRDLGQRTSLSTILFRDGEFTCYNLTIRRAQYSNCHMWMACRSHLLCVRQAVHMLLTKGYLLTTQQDPYDHECSPS